MTVKAQGAAEFVPDDADLETLRSAVQGCRGCDLHRHATQAVFGEGPKRAAVLLVGEQPGDKEDLRGAPFVGPAGKLLDRALAEAGFDRATVYLTNAVKHFKFEERGKQRIHKKPGRTEVVACLPWLLAEVDRVRPRLIVCLGATAAQAVLGTAFRLTKQRGELVDPGPGDFAGQRVVATIHPSAVLRSRDRDADYAGLVDDLRAAASLAGQVSAH
ncbi:DNA polymerase [Actinokineospora alba]|uniref:Type-4 uracil-DNA glycosylase n=1 Tax=Actinokineospora alba TaxID=504798 RepID=A0A1H0VPY0_9PSEU|nr:UdgX family uracil-DNA binding protein [Actinokineospora alba]TDP70185.1 DNA polymerase [Actinokineospora alba]SDI37241.1 DNA polymerase [Actinokineospora alba]SDP80394.1 DNA polymerase [Actinokineospora alba]